MIQAISFKVTSQQVQHAKRTLQPDILLLSSGEVSSFVLAFTREGDRIHSTPSVARIRSDLTGRIEVSYGDAES